MRRLEATRLACLATLIAGLWQVAPVRGDFIATETSSVTQQGANTYMYSYTVTVSAQSTVAVSEFDLSLGAPITTIIAPSNFFTFYTSGDPFINFTAADIGAAFVGIAPGSSGTFSFISMYAPMAGSYSIQGLDPSFNLDTMSGTAFVPGIVPEPASILLTSLGLAGLVGLSTRARRRAHAAG